MSFDILTLRGYVEKMIDSRLETKHLSQAHELFEAMKPAAVSNRMDAVFGYIIGEIYALTFNLYDSTLKREPAQEEIEEIADTLNKRLFQIKSRIMETFT